MVFLKRTAFLVGIAAGQQQDLEDFISGQIDYINSLSLNLWIVFCAVMVIMSQVGYMMKETGTIKMKNNSVILLKTILVISISSLTFFVGGFGLAMEAAGGLFGQQYFFGFNYSEEEYTKFIFYLALCVKNSVIATGSIGERIEIDRYIFFSFLTSGFIFPLGLAWCWNDGWLQNLGFKDYGGVAIVHVMGGMSGLIGTYLIGPRIGLFHLEKDLNYIYSDENLIEQVRIEEERSDESSEYESEEEVMPKASSLPNEI